MASKYNKSDNLPTSLDNSSLVEDSSERKHLIQNQTTDEINVYDVDEMLEKAGGFGKTQLLTLIACAIWYKIYLLFSSWKWYWSIDK